MKLPNLNLDNNNINNSQYNLIKSDQLVENMAVV